MLQMDAYEKFDFVLNTPRKNEIEKKGFLCFIRSLRPAPPVRFSFASLPLYGSTFLPPFPHEKLSSLGTIGTVAAWYLLKKMSDLSH